RGLRLKSGTAYRAAMRQPLACVAACLIVGCVSLAACSPAASDEPAAAGSGNAAGSGGSGNSGGLAGSTDSAGLGGSLENAGAAGESAGGAAGAAGSSPGEEDVGPLLAEGTFGPITLHNHPAEALAALDAFTQMTTDSVGNLWLLSGTDDGGYSVFKLAPDFSSEWTLEPIQTETAEPAAIRAIATSNAGDLFIAGSTPSALAGQTSAGDSDVLIAKYSSDKELRWLKQVGSENADSATFVGALADGSVLVAGNEAGPLPGGQSPDYGGPFFLTASSAGSAQTIQQTGDFSQGWEYAAVDSDGAFYGSATQVDSNFPVLKYAADGSFLWAFDDSYSRPRRLAVTAHGQYVYLFGGPFGNCELQQLGSDGTLRWQSIGAIGLFGGSSASAFAGQFDSCDALVATEHSVYVAGTGSSFSQSTGEGGAGGATADAGGRAVFVTRFDSNGNVVWFQQLAFPGFEEEGSVVSLLVDPEGNAVLGLNQGGVGLIAKLHAKDGAPFTE
ncbi:MAG: hypothetical protein ABW061_04760, partial [Polyangiaceae bacterium]